MELSGQEYRIQEPFPSPGDLPKAGIEPKSLSLQADSLPSEPPVKPINEERMSGFTSYVILGKSLRLFVPQFPSCQNSNY